MLDLSSLSLFDFIKKKRKEKIRAFAGHNCTIGAEPYKSTDLLLLFLVNFCFSNEAVENIEIVRSK